MGNAARSGLFSRKLRENPEEVGVIDTMIAPLSSAIGSLIAGLIIIYLGYGRLFLLGGCLVLVVLFIIAVCKKGKSAVN